MSDQAKLVTDGELHAVVEAATRAPSSHNTQPWHFEFRDDVISLFADRLRALPANDPFDRELTVSCGTALFNLRVALAAIGLSSQVDLLPEGRRSDLLAAVKIEAGPVADDPSLMGAIESRRTTRGPFTGDEVDPGLLDRMAAAAEAEGAWFVVLDEPLRRKASELIAEGDQRQFADPTWRRELASWMHPRRSGDGLALQGFSRPVAKLVVNAFDLGKSTGRKDAKLAEDSPCLAVLGTGRDLDEDWLTAGQALERALLLAATEGVQAGYLNQPCQVADLRHRLRDLLQGRGSPQVVLRLGHPVEGGKPAPRRDVDQVLVRR